MTTEGSAAPEHAPWIAGAPAARDRLVGRLRRICMALPDANEKLSHGEPTWFAGKGKVFAMLDDHHHGAAHLSVWLPQPFGAQEALMRTDPERFFRPPYVGVSGWVGVVLDKGPDWRELARLVRLAYSSVPWRSSGTSQEALRRCGSRPGTRRDTLRGGRAEWNAVVSSRRQAAGSGRDGRRAGSTRRPDRGGPSVQHDGVGPETGANDLVHQRGVPLPEEQVVERMTTAPTRLTSGGRLRASGFLLPTSGRVSTACAGGSFSRLPRHDALRTRRDLRFERREGRA